MDDAEIRFVGELHRLDVMPGDKFVVTFPGVLSQQQAEHIRAKWAEFMGSAHGLLVLSDGAKIGAIGTASDGE